jgi:hypothetical protein
MSHRTKWDTRRFNTRSPIRSLASKSCDCIEMAGQYHLQRADGVRVSKANEEFRNDGCVILLGKTPENCSDSADHLRIYSASELHGTLRSFGVRMNDENAAP